MTRPKDTDTYNWYATPPDHIEPLPILYGEGTGNIVSTGRVASLSIGEDTLPVTDWTVSFDPAGIDATEFLYAASTMTATEVQLLNTEHQLLNTEYQEAVRKAVLDATKHIEEIKFIADIEFAKKKPRLLLLTN